MHERAVHEPSLLQGMDALTEALRHPETPVMRYSLLSKKVVYVSLEEACRLASDGFASRLFVELPS